MTREPIIFDTELIGSTFLLRCLHVPSGRRESFWGDRPDQLDRVQLLINNPNYTWVGFNSDKFDLPVLTAVLGGRPISQVKIMADRMIRENLPTYVVYRDFGLERLDIDHIDLIETAPGVLISLKLYMARLAAETIQDMPFDHTSEIEAKDRSLLEGYCDNDVTGTALLWERLQEPIALREKMGEEFRIDLRSKSDAQMAEAIIINKLGLARKGAVLVPKSVRYKAPQFIQPRSAIVADILSRVEKHVFDVNPGNGAVTLPAFLANEQVLIGSGSYQMGIGGLHSTHDKRVFIEAGDNLEISDWDVGSFYPNILINAGLIPRNLGMPFIDLYQSLLVRRMEAKRSGNKAIDKGLKIALNGTFGKLGSMFSKIYSPDLMLAITLTGQFYLLNLIEDLTDLGVTVISANTDGVCICGTPENMKRAADWIACYGFLTGFEFEETKYRKIAIRDVNSYCAIKLDGKAKVKGAFALVDDTQSGLMKNPTNEVCTLAAQAYLATGRSIESFIREHLRPENLLDFTQARSVKGGAVQFSGSRMVDDWIQRAPREWVRPGWPVTRAPVRRVSPPEPVCEGTGAVFLGRVVRWYYSTDKSLSIRYASNGNLVPKSEGGRPMMTVLDRVPADIDVMRYVEETRENLRSAGVPA